MNKVLYHASLYDGSASSTFHIVTLFLKETTVEHSLCPYKAYEVVDIVSYDEVVSYVAKGVIKLNQTDLCIEDTLDEDLVKERAKALLGSHFEFIDLKGEKISPEFLDFHEHSEFYSFFDPSLLWKRKQFVRASVLGNCGISVYPLVKGKEALLEENVRSILGEWPSLDGKKIYWKDLNEFQDVLKKRGVNNRLLFLTGHSALRIAAMEGNPNREASDAEIEKMCAFLQEMIDQGSIGFSTGLYYAPCIFASRKELLSLLKVVSKNNAIFAVHIREEGNRLLESLEEVISLSKEAGCRLEISHLKAIGKKNQKKVDAALYLIENARSEGLDVMFDQYPYTYGSTSLFSLLPPDVLRLSEVDMINTLKNKNERERIKNEMLFPKNWESIAELCTFKNVFIQALGNTNEYDNLSINSIAIKQNKDPFDVFFDCLIESDGLALMKDTTTTDESIKKIYTHPLSIYASDSLYAGNSWHERSKKCTLKSLDIARDIRPFYPLSLSVHRMTGKGAMRLGLEKYFICQKGSVMNFVNLDRKEYV